MSKRIILYIGTYTHYLGHLKAANGQGIHIFELDRETGQLSPLGIMDGLENPSFLTIDKTGHFLYAGQEREDGTVSAYAIDQTTGQLTYLNGQSSLGSYVAYVSIDKTSNHVFSVNYACGQSVTMYQTNANGGLFPASISHLHDEKPEGTIPARQDKSHTHSVVVDPTNTYAMVCDLGLDKVFVYRIDGLESHDFLKVTSGAGPRHLIFHPSGKYAYVANELNSTVNSLIHENGTLKITQTLSTLPTGYNGENYSSDIHITPLGKFVYVANRGHDSLAIFTVNSSNGKLSLVGHQSTKGEVPRNFAIDPTGTFLLAANQNSDTIVTFRINQQTGGLEDTGHVASCGTPVCLKMIEL